MDFEILPCSLLLLRYSHFREYDEVALICPVSRLFDKSNATKNGKDNKEGGINILMF